MVDEPAQMKSIWYLVGLLLLAMGTVITVTGIYQYLNPPATTTVLAHLHPGLWWGFVMLAAGAAFYFGARNRTR